MCVLKCILCFLLLNVLTSDCIKNGASKNKAHEIFASDYEDENIGNDNIDNNQNPKISARSPIRFEDSGQSYANPSQYYDNNPQNPGSYQQNIESYPQNNAAYMQNNAVQSQSQRYPNTDNSVFNIGEYQSNSDQVDQNVPKPKRKKKPNKASKYSNYQNYNEQGQNPNYGRPGYNQNQFGYNQFDVSDQNYKRDYPNYESPYFGPSTPADFGQRPYSGQYAQNSGQYAQNFGQYAYYPNDVGQYQQNGQYQAYPNQYPQNYNQRPYPGQPGQYPPQSGQQPQNPGQRPYPGQYPYQYPPNAGQFGQYPQNYGQSEQESSITSFGRRILDFILGQDSALLNAKIPRPGLANNPLHLPPLAEALGSLSRNDDLQCVPKLLCDVVGEMAPKLGDPQKILPSFVNLESVLNLASVLPTQNPVLSFGRAILQGVSNPFSCTRSYPNCPREPEKLVYYLNNHRGGFFRFFNGGSQFSSAVQSQNTQPSGSLGTAGQAGLSNLGGLANLASLGNLLGGFGQYSQNNYNRRLSESQNYSGQKYRAKRDIAVTNSTEQNYTVENDTHTTEESDLTPNNLSSSEDDISVPANITQERIVNSKKILAEDEEGPYRITLGYLGQSQNQNYQNEISDNMRNQNYDNIRNQNYDSTRNQNYDKYNNINYMNSQNIKYMDIGKDEYILENGRFIKITKDNMGQIFQNQGQQATSQGFRRPLNNNYQNQNSFSNSQDLQNNQAAYTKYKDSVFPDENNKYSVKNYQTQNSFANYQSNRDNRQFFPEHGQNIRGSKSILNNNQNYDNNRQLKSQQFFPEYVDNQQNLGSKFIEQPNNQNLDVQKQIYRKPKSTFFPDESSQSSNLKNYRMTRKLKKAFFPNLEPDEPQNSEIPKPLSYYDRANEMFPLRTGTGNLRFDNEYLRTQREPNFELLGNQNQNQNLNFGSNQQIPNYYERPEELGEHNNDRPEDFLKNLKDDGEREFSNDFEFPSAYQGMVYNTRRNGEQKA